MTLDSLRGPRRNDVHDHAVVKLRRAYRHQGAPGVQRSGDYAFVALLAQHLPSWHVPTVTGGQCLWVRLPYGDGTSFAQATLHHHLAILPGAALDITTQSDAHLRLHFRATPADLTEAVTRLTAAWATYSPPPTKIHPTPSITI